MQEKDKNGQPDCFPRDSRNGRIIRLPLKNSLMDLHIGQTLTLSIDLCTDWRLDCDQYGMALAREMGLRQVRMPALRQKRTLRIRNRETITPLQGLIGINPTLRSAR